MTRQIIVGDAREALARLKKGSVDCVVTSPPYWGLRAYGTRPQVWDGDPGCEHRFVQRRYYTENGAGGAAGEAFSKAGPANAERLKKARWRTDERCGCGAWRGELGLERRFEDYVAHLVEIFREVRRTLRDDGTVWLNMGDCFNTYPANRGAGRSFSKSSHDVLPAIPKGYGLSAPGLKNKDLVGIPWRVALALQDDGWFLRCDVVWDKPNGLPFPVKDRPVRTHEYVFMLTKSARYRYDAAAVQESTTDGKARRHMRSVWQIPTVAHKGGHAATFPPALPARCIAAGCRPGGTVLDPFAGSGTTLAAAEAQGRGWVGIDVDRRNLAEMRERIPEDARHEVSILDLQTPEK